MLKRVTNQVNCKFSNKVLTVLCCYFVCYEMKSHGRSSAAEIHWGTLTFKISDLRSFSHFYIAHLPTRGLHLVLVATVTGDVILVTALFRISSGLQNQK